MKAAEFAKLVERPKRRADGKWWDARCPKHDDKRASLSFTDGDRGLVVKCHAGCSTEAIAAALGLEMAALFPRNQEAAEPTIVATHDYCDERNTLLYQSVRYEPKDFRVRRPNGRGGWTWNLAGVRRVVYRLPELAEAERVILTEGEKCADRVTTTLGVPATTTVFGADNWRDEYADQIKAAGVEEMPILLDHDPPGERYAAGAARSLMRRMIRVKLVRLPGLPEHGDVVDYLDAGHSAGELAAAIEATPWLEDPPELVVAPAPAGPRVTLEGDEGVLTWAETEVEIRMIGAREHSEGVTAECAVRLRGVDVHWGRLNLASTSAREQLVKKLGLVEPGVAWREYLELACRRVADHVRTGEPLVALCPAPRPAAQRDLVAGVLPIGETSVLYGDGDAGKGWLALLMAVAVTTGTALPHLRPTRRVARVLYLDWESSRMDLEARLDGLCRGLRLTLPPGAILYRPMSRALADEAPRLRADVAREGVEFVIVDSFGPACGAEPESADATIRAMNALRSFEGTTRLVVAHVSKLAADQPKGATRPYGSVFVRNLARSAWEVRRADDVLDDLVTAAYHRKHNAGRRSAAFALRFAFDAAAGTVAVHSSPLGDTPDLLARAPLAARILAALTTGADTVEALAERLEAKLTSVRKTCERLAVKGLLVQVGDARPYKWGLAAK